MSALDPYTPPADNEATREGGKRSPSSWPDLLLTLSLGVMLLPATLVNGVLWAMYFAHIGLYDPRIGSNPAWLRRPAFIAVVVCVVALARLGLSHVRIVAPGYRRALLIIGVVAAITVVMACIPEPDFSGFTQVPSSSK